jgi:hypothetical protein
MDQVFLVNNWADKQAKEAPWLPLQAALLPHPSLPSPQYTSREIQEVLAKGPSCAFDGWLQEPDHHLLLPNPLNGKFYQTFISLSILDPIPYLTSLNMPLQEKGCLRL